MSDILLHNWTQEVELESSWSTDVVYSRTTVSEQRKALLNERPYRNAQVTWQTWSKDLAYRLFMQLQRMSSAPALIPLYQDVAHLTADSSGVTLTCVTTNRRFYPGVQVAVHSVNSNNEPANIQIRTILSLTPTAITLTAGVTGTYLAGSRVYPLMSCLQGLGYEIKGRTDELWEVVADVTEELTEDAIPPSADDDDAPVEFETYVDPRTSVEYPIFHFQPDWTFDVVPSVIRIGAEDLLGRQPVVDVQGTRPMFAMQSTISQFDRDQFQSLLQFFDSRRGRLRPFWVMNPMSLWVPTDLDTDHVTVEQPEGADFQDVLDYVQFVGLMFRDGRVVVRSVIGDAADLGSTWRFDFADLVVDMPPLADLVAVSTAHLVRFQSDSLTERWRTDEASFCSFAVQEVHEEQEVEITL